MKKFLEKIVPFSAIVIFLVIILGNHKVQAAGTSQYYITINYGANVVTIYSKDGNGNYVPYKSMVCSCGTATPTGGTYSLNYKYRWLALFGGVYGQYCSRIVGNILFHSVPYLRNGDPSSLEYWEYDKLGQSASAGCIRLTVEDAKWIYENCSSGTKITFFSSSDTGPLGKPTTMKISNLQYRDWDPTDKSSNNPWNNILNVTFNAKYYADTNTDIKAIYGYDETCLKNHWYAYGIQEGRSSSEVFDVKYYLENNGDLKTAFGDDYYSAYYHYLKDGYQENRRTASNFYAVFYKNFYKDLKNMSNLEASLHYITNGKNEHRTATISQELENIVFNSNYYADINPDLKIAYGYDEGKLKNHWYNCGIHEGRCGSEVFDSRYYLQNNGDLKDAYGNDFYSAYRHFLNYGYHENRRTSNQFYSTFYKNFYSDLNNMSNLQASLHYIVDGQKEHRTATISEELESIVFNSEYYANQYQDLKSAYGKDEQLLKIHWFRYGLKEGRGASPIFNISQYFSYNQDLVQAFGENYSDGLLHFLSNGIKESRQTSEMFNVNIYRTFNGDLENAYGENYIQYYMHYINYGCRENRRTV